MQPSAGLLFVLGLSLFPSVNAGPYVRRNTVALRNKEDVITLNAEFKTLSPSSPCAADEVACINDSVARCVEGRFKLTPCGDGLVCRASPQRGFPGTTVKCTTEGKNAMRARAIGTNYAVSPNDTSQSSLTLDPSVISTGYLNDGQDNITSPGQMASGTSSNNWINFCMTVDKPLTNGSQITTGSCNPTPIGVIPSVDNMPSAKFIFPPNFEVLSKGNPFTIKIAIDHLDTGWFTNSHETYMSSPVQVNADGDVIGHSHIVVERLTGFGQTTPPDPKTFVFFKLLTDPAVDGVLSTNVTGGLPAGFYRLAVFHAGANHQQIGLPVAQHGAGGDMVYFSVI